MVTNEVVGKGANMKLLKLLEGKWLSGIGLIAQYGLGCVFLLSSVPKLYGPYQFLGSLYEYELVGPKVGLAAAIAVPFLELVLAICLLGGVFTPGAFLGSACLLGLFTFVQSWAIWRHLPISCACFGGLGAGTINYMTLIRTLLLLGLATTGLACWSRCHARAILRACQSSQ